jgi:hypothetical protein
VTEAALSVCYSIIFSFSNAFHAYCGLRLAACLKEKRRLLKTIFHFEQQKIQIEQASHRDFGYLHSLLPCYKMAPGNFRQ